MARIRNTANRSMKAALAKCSANRRYRIWPLRGQLGNVLAPLRTLPPSIRGTVCEVTAGQVRRGGWNNHRSRVQPILKIMTPGKVFSFPGRLPLAVVQQ
jgi:hypothetical protein